jgi:hypothetical protein
MGEQPQKMHVEITLSPETISALQAAAWRETAEQQEQPSPATPTSLGLTSWQFYSSSAGCEVVAYVDDHNQVRHVPVTRVGDVPAHWQRVWLEERRR